MLDILRMDIMKELLRKMAKEERCLFLALGQGAPRFSVAGDPSSSTRCTSSRTIGFGNWR
jgi:hypothetical protein